MRTTRPTSVLILLSVFAQPAVANARAEERARKLTLDPARHNSFYLLRHGESTGNRAGRLLSGIPALFRFGLTPQGEREAKEAAGEARRLGLPHDTILVVSPLRRARQTAFHFGRAAGLKATTLRGVARGLFRFSWSVRERGFGRVNGARYTDYKAIKDGPDGRRELARRGVESMASVEARIADAITRLDQQHEGKTFVIVAHDNPLAALLATLPEAQASGYTEDSFKIPHATLLPLDASAIERSLKPE